MALSRAHAGVVYSSTFRKATSRFISCTSRRNLSEQSGPDREDKRQTSSRSRTMSEANPLGTRSLHVAPVRWGTTAKEFRDAFAGIDGLRTIQFAPGGASTRQYKTTKSGRWNYGILHFRDQESAGAAIERCQQLPVRINGLQAEVTPRTQKMPVPGEKTHVLRITNLPPDLSYEEVVELLKQQGVKYESIRFMFNGNGEFHGNINIICDSIPSAVEARRLLLNCMFRGTVLLQQNFGYAGALFEDKPTPRLMVKGIPKSLEGVTQLNNVIRRVDGMMGFEPLKEKTSHGMVYKGYAIIGCKDVPAAWRVLNRLNRYLPHLRIVFMLHKQDYEQKTLDNTPKIGNPGQETLVNPVNMLTFFGIDRTDST